MARQPRRKTSRSSTRSKTVQDGETGLDPTVSTVSKTETQQDQSSPENEKMATAEANVQTDSSTIERNGVQFRTETVATDAKGDKVISKGKGDSEITLSNLVLELPVDLPNFSTWLGGEDKVYDYLCSVVKAQKKTKAANKVTEIVKALDEGKSLDQEDELDKVREEAKISVPGVRTTSSGAVKQKAAHMEQIMAAVPDMSLEDILAKLKAA